VNAEELLAYADALYNLARHLTGNEADGQDLVQETFARAVAARRSFQGGNLKAWLFRILRNAYIDQYRRRKNGPVTVGLEVEPRAAPVADELELQPARRLVNGEIAAALASLPETAREVVLLDLEGLTEVEVAGVLGCAVGTVKSRLSRARATLREKLAAHRNGA
jgi:RNA polymerase sigma-70 factor (ECF subfamily)